MLQTDEQARMTLPRETTLAVESFVLRVRGEGEKRKDLQDFIKSLHLKTFPSKRSESKCPARGFLECVGNKEKQVLLHERLSEGDTLGGEGWRCSDAQLNVQRPNPAAAKGTPWGRFQPFSALT